MKKLIALLIPAALLTAVIGFGVATPATANAADIALAAHTENRSCGSHRHHHGHYWSCGGCTYYCCGHR